MKIFNKKFVKVAAIFAVIIILAAGAVWLLQYYNWRKSPEYQAQKYIDEMTRKYQEDTYGGSTPEETLQLFIDALKKGDIELAAKYFVVEKQEEMKNNFKIGQEKGSLKDFLVYLDKSSTGKEIYEGAYIFTFSENKKVLISIDLTLNKLSGKWKIESL